VVMQNAQQRPGDPATTVPSPHDWCSPIREPRMLGTWDQVLSKRVRDLHHHPNEIRVTEGGRAELARIRRSARPAPPPEIAPSPPVNAVRGASPVMGVVEMKPYGWTKEELCKQGIIGPTLFDEICRKAGVKRPKSGEHGFRFGREVVKRLADVAARAAGKRKWGAAARLWSQLLNDESTPSASSKKD